MSLKRFETYLRARGRSETTVQRYLQVAQSFMTTTGKMSGFTINDVLEVLASKGTGTHKRFLFFVLKTFFKSLEIEWTLGREDTPSKNEPTRPYFNLEETEQIYKTVEQGSLRDRALLHVAGITGCRRQEYSNMNREDLKGERLYIRTAKHGDPRWRVLDPVTINHLNAYLSSRRDTNPALFIGTKGRLTVTQLSRILKSYLNKAGITKPRAGYHSFRRGLVTILHKRGLSEKEIQDYGGWKSPFMVHEYIQLEPGEVENKVKEKHPAFEE